MRTSVILLLIAVLLAGCTAPDVVSPAASDEASDDPSNGAPAEASPAGEDLAPWEFVWSDTITADSVGLVTVGSVAVGDDEATAPLFALHVPAGTTHFEARLTGEGTGFLTMEVTPPSGEALYPDDVGRDPVLGAPVHEDASTESVVAVERPSVGTWTFVVRPLGAYVGEATLEILLLGVGEAPTEADLEPR